MLFFWLIGTHVYRRRLVLHEAGGVRGLDRPGKSDDFRVEVLGGNAINKFLA